MSTKKKKFMLSSLELELRNDCTFSPVVSSPTPSKPLFKRLENEIQSKREKISQLRDQKKENEMRECSFKPKISDFDLERGRESFFSRERKKRREWENERIELMRQGQDDLKAQCPFKPRIGRYNFRRSRSKFFEDPENLRPKNKLFRKTRSRSLVTSSFDLENEQECTFHPTISTYSEVYLKRDSNQPIYSRLFEISKKKKVEEMMKEKENRKSERIIKPNHPIAEKLYNESESIEERKKKKAGMIKKLEGQKRRFRMSQSSHNLLHMKIERLRNLFNTYSALSEEFKEKLKHQLVSPPPSLHSRKKTTMKNIMRKKTKKKKKKKTTKNMKRKTIGGANRKNKSQQQQQQHPFLQNFRNGKRKSSFLMRKKDIRREIAIRERMERKRRWEELLDRKKNEGRILRLKKFFEVCKDEFHLVSSPPHLKLRSSSSLTVGGGGGGGLDMRRKKKYQFSRNEDVEDLYHIFKKYALINLRNEMRKKRKEEKEKEEKEKNKKLEIVIQQQKSLSQQKKDEEEEEEDDEDEEEDDDETTKYDDETTKYDDDDDEEEEELIDSTSKNAPKLEIIDLKKSSSYFDPEDNTSDDEDYDDESKFHRNMMMMKKNKKKSKRIQKELTWSDDRLARKYLSELYIKESQFIDIIVRDFDFKSLHKRLKTNKKLYSSTEYLNKMKHRRKNNQLYKKYIQKRIQQQSSSSSTTTTTTPTRHQSGDPFFVEDEELEEEEFEEDGTRKNGKKKKKERLRRSTDHQNLPIHEKLFLDQKILQKKKKKIKEKRKKELKEKEKDFCTFKPKINIRKSRGSLSSSDNNNNKKGSYNYEHQSTSGSSPSKMYDDYVQNGHPLAPRDDDNDEEFEEGSEEALLRHQSFVEMRNIQPGQSHFDYLHGLGKKNVTKEELEERRRKRASDHPPSGGPPSHSKGLPTNKKYRPKFQTFGRDFSSIPSYSPHTIIKKSQNKLKKKEVWKKPPNICVSGTDNYLRRRIQAQIRKEKDKEEKKKKENKFRKSKPKNTIVEPFHFENREERKKNVVKSNSYLQMEEDRDDRNEMEKRKRVMMMESMRSERNVVLQMEIKVKKSGETGVILIRRGDDPRVLARDFSEKFDLGGMEAQIKIENLVRRNMQIHKVL